MLITKEQSFQIKGIAILLLLSHHLFGCNIGGFEDVYNIFHILGNIGKCCVSLFVILSGYGLMLTYKDYFNLKKYLIKRSVKLYSNYWLIWIIFVPIGIFFFNKPFDYGNAHRFFYFFADLLGVINCFGKFGYCDTWWFYSCIILLYLLFPLLKVAIDNNKPFFGVLLCALLLLSIFYRGGMGLFNPIRYYLVPFMVGMMLSKSTFDFLSYKNIVHIASLFLLFVCCYARISHFLPFIFDCIIALSILFAWMSHNSISYYKYIESTLFVLGKHSFNIFLFHTFIIEFFFRDFFFYSKSPFVIFAMSLACCFIISIAIERIKIIIGFNKFFNSVSL